MSVKIDVVRNILSKCDLLICQEIFLPEEEVAFVHGIDNNFSCFVSPSRLPNSITFNGRPAEGFAIFYRKALNLTVDLISSQQHFVFVSVGIGNETVGMANI